MGINMNEYEIFLTNVENILASKGITSKNGQAVYLKLSRGTWLKIKDGSVIANFKTMARIANALGSTVRELLVLKVK